MKQQDIYSEVYLIGGFAGRVLLSDFRSTFDIDFILEEINDNHKLDIFNDLIHQKIIESCDPKKLSTLIKLYKGDILNPDNMNYNFHTMKDFLKRYNIDT